MHGQEIYMKTKRAHFQSMKEVQGSFKDLKCIHVLKQEKENIKGTREHSKEMKE